MEAAIPGTQVLQETEILLLNGSWSVSLTGGACSKAPILKAPRLFVKVSETLAHLRVCAGGAGESQGPLWRLWQTPFVGFPPTLLAQVGTPVPD